MIPRFYAIVAAFAVVAWCAPAFAESPDSPPEPEPREHTLHVGLGVGVPEILHAELGFYPVRWFSIDASVAVLIFNLVGGLGATYHHQFSSGALVEEFSAGVRARLNLVDEPLELKSGGERIGGSVDVLAGYMVQAPSGLFGRVRVGALFYDDSGFAAGPLLLGSVGWRF